MMRTRYAQAAALLFSLMLGACAALTPYQPLPPPARDAIASSDVVVPIHQSEIYVYVPASNVSAAAGGGLLAALIDVAVNDVRTSKAEAAVKPLRDALVDFDFDAALRDDVKDDLSQIAWLHVKDTRVVKEVTDQNLDAILGGSKGDAVLFAAADYSLDNDGVDLTVTLQTRLFPNTAALRAMLKGNTKSQSKIAPQNALYRDQLKFQTKAPGLTGDRDHNIAVWSADHGALMQAALKQAAAKLAQMFAADLQRPEKESPGTEPITIGAAKGSVVGRDADGVLVRFEDGTMEYATNAYFAH